MYLSLNYRVKIVMVIVSVLCDCKPGPNRQSVLGLFK